MEQDVQKEALGREGAVENQDSSQGRGASKENQGHRESFEDEGVEKNHVVEKKILEPNVDAVENLNTKRYGGVKNVVKTNVRECCVDGNDAEKEVSEGGAMQRTQGCEIVAEDYKLCKRCTKGNEYKDKTTEGHEQGFEVRDVEGNDVVEVSLKGESNGKSKKSQGGKCEKVEGEELDLEEQVSENIIGVDEFQNEQCAQMATGQDCNGERPMQCESKKVEGAEVSLVKSKMNEDIRGERSARANNTIMRSWARRALSRIG